MKDIIILSSAISFTIGFCLAMVSVCADIDEDNKLNIIKYILYFIGCFSVMMAFLWSPMLYIKMGWPFYAWPASIVVIWIGCSIGKKVIDYRK
jgi:hypothetical protein